MPTRSWVAPVLATVSLSAPHCAFGSPQCPDLSGAYVMQGEDGQVQIVITQHDCDRIEIVRNNNYLGTVSSERHTLKLDGKDQKDSPWLGSPEQYRISAKFVGSELHVKARTTTGSALTMIYSLNSAGDLLEDGLTARRVVPIGTKRQKRSR